MLHLLQILCGIFCLPFKRHRHPDETPILNSSPTPLPISTPAFDSPDQDTNGSRKSSASGKTPHSEVAADESIPPLMEVSSINNALFGAEVPSSIYSRKYIPAQTFDGLVTEEAVQRAIRAIPESDKTLRHIFDNARKVFSTLIAMGGGCTLKTIQKCVEFKFCDDNLPIIYSKEDGILSYKSFKNGDYVECPAATEFFSDWEAADVGRFCDTQWKFLVPVFDSRQFNYVLRKECLLPYEEIPGNKKDSYFSTVTKVRIHEEHINSELFLDIPGHELAMKELKSVTDTEGLSQQIGSHNQRDIDEKRFEDERDTLELIRTISGVRMIKAIAAIKQGNKFSFLFPWTDVGNLRDFWKTHPSNDKGPFLTAETLKWSLEEMRQIAYAIKKLHHTSKPEEPYGRHGDLKPENVLVFEDPNSHTQSEQVRLGRLYIADMGLVRFHSILTPYRVVGTTTMAGTDRYIAPEIPTLDKARKPRSRSCDIWSMGCIYLEFLIWLLYGYKRLEVFDGLVTQFFTSEAGLGVHTGVTDMITFIRDNEPRCARGLVLRGLLDLIDEKLLIIEHEESNGRITAEEMHRELKALYEKAEKGDHKYLSEPGIPSSPPSRTWLSPGAARAKTQSTSLRPLAEAPEPPDHEKSAEGENDSSAKFDTPDIVDQEDAKEVNEGEEVKKRKEYVSQWYTSFYPAIRVLLTFNYAVTIGDDFYNSTLILTGFPKLPSPGSDVQFQLIREWLRDCDEKHHCQKRPLSNLPRRVIDVGDEGQQYIRLKCDTSSTRDIYVVLSHRWGKPTGQPRFGTLCANIESFKDYINLDDLPQTFKDAVIVTRHLGIKFLWIDSLCIIQDSAEDWITESAKMDEIFNSAYCTIAASSAGSTTEGFLRERQERETVVIQKDEADPLYISEVIDNFRGDIEEGELNQRGWVLQERALSRRTIYFSERQMYWECGLGVRCETLTRLYNLKSAFLGDPNFPEYAMRHYKGGRIRLYQALYEKYSGLSFTFETDRSIAIRGLEQRLVRGFGTLGGYGVFECYFHRSLLWKRSDAILSRIYYPPDRPVPSWSWMYNSGRITYVDLPFGEIDWSADVISPFRENPHRKDGKYWMGNQMREELGIQARARNFAYSDAVSSITFDRNDDYEPLSLRCVIVGRDKPWSSKKDKLCYVMIIKPTMKTEGSLTESTMNGYERVGVGSIRAEYIDIDQSIDVLII
ncbi:HET-domain-containing protein [Daldinia eschscholtzii]|nr:HET-domain-containing protein [Daldinia eschscholtzii]